jgi:hypothetical protein
VQQPDRLLPAAPGGNRMSPTVVIRELDRILRERGLTRLYSAACEVLGVVSVCTGLTV